MVEAIKEIGIMLANNVFKYDNHGILNFCINTSIIKHIPDQTPDKRNPSITHKRNPKKIHTFVPPQISIYSFVHKYFL